MPIFRESHQLTSVTIKVNQITDSVRDDLDDSVELYVAELLALIKVQNSTGVLEALRAIRKKIKYGLTVSEQIRALYLLELLVSNAGPKIAPLIASDDKLVDVLKQILSGKARTGNGNAYNKEVINKVNYLASHWKSELAGLKGFDYLANLWKAIPGRKSTSAISLPKLPSNVFEEGSSTIPHDSDDSRSPSPERRKAPRPPSRTTKPSRIEARESKSDAKQSKYDKRAAKALKHSMKSKSRFADPQYKIPQINYKVEAPKIRALIAKSHTDATHLHNLLLHLPQDASPEDDDECSTSFNQCKSDRRKTLRYLQYVGAGDPSTKTKDILNLDDEFLGSLIVLNEQLVEVFKIYDRKSGYTEENPAPVVEEEDSSDESYYSSDDEEEELEEQLQKVTLKSPPPRPAKPPTLNRLETNTSIASDPFGDGKGL